MWPGDDHVVPVSSPHPVQLPQRWPSAWPSLWPGVRDRTVFVAVTVSLTVLGLARFGDLGLAWWVALLPLVLLIGPLTRPSRARRAIQRAARQRTLNVRESGNELLVSVPRRSVTARVAANGAVTYRTR